MQINLPELNEETPPGDIIDYLSILCALIIQLAKQQSLPASHILHGLHVAIEDAPEF